MPQESGEAAAPPLYFPEAQALCGCWVGLWGAGAGAWGMESGPSVPCLVLLSSCSCHAVFRQDSKLRQRASHRAEKDMYIAETPRTKPFLCGLHSYGQILLMKTSHSNPP